MAHDDNHSDDNHSDESLGDNSAGNHVDLQLIEALLPFAYDSQQSQNEQRIKRLMDRLDRSPDSTAEITDSDGNVNSPIARRFTSRRSTFTAMIATLAAGMLLCIFYATGILGPAESAHAALGRCVARLHGSFTYDVTLKNRLPIRGIRETRATLYLNENQSWVLEHPDLPLFGHAWIGGDSQRRWLVPDAGPAIIGSGQAVDLWMFDNKVHAPAYHLISLLDQLNQNYDLQLGDQQDSALSTSQFTKLPAHDLRLIHGTKRSPETTGPDTVAVWAKRKDDRVIRLQLRWTDEGRSGPLQWTFDLSDQAPKPAPSWFDPETHIQPQQPIWQL